MSRPVRVRRIRRFVTEFGFRFRAGSKLAHWTKKNRKRLVGIVVRRPKPKHRLVRVPMFDDVTASRIPADAKAVAVYVDGRYANEAAVRRHAPHAKVLTIAVFPHDDADCLDIENGDATPAQAPVWVARQIKRGVKRPVVYSSVSEMPAVIHELERAGIKREAVLLWTAHYTFKRHICSKKCNPFFVWTADGTQWTDRSRGESLDESWVSDAFFE